MVLQMKPFLIAMTDEFELFTVSINDLKKIAHTFTGWYCHVGRDVLQIIQQEDKLVGSTCANPSNICEQKLCWCGTDLEIVKGIDKQTVDFFESNVRENRNNILDPHSNLKMKGDYGGQKLVAFGFLNTILEQLQHIDWNLLLRCNFDCSYCPPTVHTKDKSIPVPSWQECRAVYEKYVTGSRKKRITLTGGEPFLIRGKNNGFSKIKHNRQN